MLDQEFEDRVMEAALQPQDADRSAVDRAIAAVILPMVYAAIDDLIDAAGDRVPKDLLIRCKRLLPGNRRNSFERAK